MELKRLIEHLEDPALHRELDLEGAYAIGIGEKDGQHHFYLRINSDREFPAFVVRDEEQIPLVVDRNFLPPMAL